MRLTGNTGGCDDGTCPAIWDTDDPQFVGVQGAVLTDAEALADAGNIPAHERIVLLPRSILEQYRSTRP